MKQKNEKKKPAFAHRINIYMAEETRQVLDQKAKKRKQSLSQLIRDAIHAL